MAALFISDLHLAESRPQLARLFFDFLDDKVKGKAAALYILGDLFEYWVGDEDIDQPFNRRIVDAIRVTAGSGVKVFVMHGNRDFLLGKRFCKESGAMLLDDPTLIDLDGTPTLLTHGDAFCTDDLAYQRYRNIVRHPVWQKLLLWLPAAVRRAIAQAIRNRSESDKQTKSDAIMDVNAGAVDGAFKAHGFPRMIHGHTHRPAHHQHTLGGHACERWVLQDWYQTGGYLQCDAAGCRVFPVTPR
jgi:UDP-2,3-diacylglucosamine hydrolase